MSKIEPDMEDSDEKVLDALQIAECERYAEKYVQNCRQFELTVDPSVVIALKTGWSVLKPSKTYGEGSLLPLMGILEGNKCITKVNLEDVSMRDFRYSLH
jgi:hypothetical protein